MQETSDAATIQLTNYQLTNVAFLNRKFAAIKYQFPVARNMYVVPQKVKVQPRR